MIPVHTHQDASTATAVFFDSQDVASLSAAIEKASQVAFDPIFIRQHAEKFHESKFVEQIKDYVTDTFEEFHSRGKHSVAAN
jgi:hypothetical protein